MKNDMGGVSCARSGSEHNPAMTLVSSRTGRNLMNPPDGGEYAPCFAILDLAAMINRYL
jgi:hypothetical protein